MLQNLTKKILLIYFICLLNLGVFYYYIENDSEIVVAQSTLSDPLNSTNTTSTTLFNETSSVFAANSIIPRTVNLNPSQNVSETQELRAPEIEVRQKFMELEEREEVLEEINPSPEESTQEQQAIPNGNIDFNDSMSSNVTSPFSDSIVSHELSSSFVGMNRENISLANTSTNINSPTTDGFRIHRDSDLAGTIPSDVMFFRNEPAVARAEDIVFYVGTYYATVSRDDGHTWNYIDLWNQMPLTCCDSDLIFDDRNRVFLWSMMNFPYNGTSSELGQISNISLGVSADTSLWQLYDIGPETLNASWTNNVFDYPQLFMTEKYVYISVNRFSNWSSIHGGRIFEGPIMMRIERDLLNTGASQIPLEFVYTTPPAEVFTGVQNADDIMYWATHVTNATNSTMRLYTWGDDSSIIRSVDRSIANFNDSNKFYCESPDNFNWCQKSDHRITGGWKQGDIIGFLWNVPPGETFPYTYVDAATFDTSDMRYIGRPYLWNKDHAWAYAFVYPDKDILGIVAAFGGGNVSRLYPGSAVGVGIPERNSGNISWNMYYAINGTNGPADNEWGDYFRTSAINVTDNENKWIGTGFALQGGNSSKFLRPHYFEFGLINTTRIQ